MPKKLKMGPIFKLLFWKDVLNSLFLNSDFFSMLLFFRIKNQSVDLSSKFGKIYAVNKKEPNIGYVFYWIQKVHYNNLLIFTLFIGCWFLRWKFSQGYQISPCSDYNKKPACGDTWRWSGKHRCNCLSWKGKESRSLFYFSVKS